MRVLTNRLALRHLLAIILVSAVFSLAATGIQVRIQYKHGVEGREEILRMIEESHLPPVAASVFFFDETQLRLLAEGISLHPYVETVTILEYRAGEEVPLLSLDARNSPDDREGRNGDSRSFPLVYEHDGLRREIGVLRVATSLADLRRQLIRQASLIAVTNLFKIFGFAVVVLVVAQRMIFRHLREIRKFFTELDPLQISRRKLVLPRSAQRSGRRPDELDEITGAINATLERLDTTMEEKQTLLQELYHRTTNTMQSIRAILNLQSSRARGNEELQATVREVDNRILAMALVHQKLYESQSLSRIGMRDYLTELAEETVRSYGVADEKIRLAVDVEDLQLLIDIAIPCGMILSELLSNALKHAFPGDRRGTISIALHRVRPGTCRLVVADNGAGFRDGFDYRSGETIGLQSVAAIAERQLNGSIEFDGTVGARWSILFSEDVYQERVADG